MRIAIDATAALVRSAGVKNYVWHWVRALRDAGCDLTLFPMLGDVGFALDHEGSALSRIETMARFGLINIPSAHFRSTLRGDVCKLRP